MDTATALLVADLVGVAVFAASGASAGVVKRLDLFGVVFVGCVAALGGGVLRDVVINDVPAAGLRRLALPRSTAAVASLIVFRFHPQLARLRRTVLVLDAAGLGLFTAAGTLKALDFGVPVVGSCILGMITGIGGGLLRDLLTGEIPLVLRREIYAVAALIGAVVVAVGDRLDAARPAPARRRGHGIVIRCRDAAAGAPPSPATLPAGRAAAAVRRAGKDDLACLAAVSVVAWSGRLRAAPPARGSVASGPDRGREVGGWRRRAPRWTPSRRCAPGSAARWSSTCAGATRTSSPWRPRAPARRRSPCASRPNCSPTARSTRSPW